jgi:hypothetical protein
MKRKLKEKYLIFIFDGMPNLPDRKNSEYAN